MSGSTLVNIRLVHIWKKGVGVQKRLLYLSLFYGVALVVMVLSLLPIEHPSVSPNDKVNHIIAYTSLMILGYLAHRRYLWVLIGVIGWGILIEILQGQTSYRMMSFADVVANSAGGLLGCVVMSAIQKIRHIQTTR